MNEADYKGVLPIFSDKGIELSAIKLEYIANIKARSQYKIYGKYPVYKQINIGRSPLSSESVIMFEYIDNIRFLSNAALFEIESATSVEVIYESIANFINNIK